MDDALPAAPVLAGEVLPPAPAKEYKPWQFKPGDPRINRKGRINGSKNVLGNSFLKDLVKWHRKHGWKAIEKVGREKPEKLLEIMASMIPKEAYLGVNVEHGGNVVLGSIELQELEQRTADLLARIEDRIDPAVGQD